ncbi:addiction module antitoxin [Candidatus Regiella insecticola LSR1]|uniref:Addiction module antitoxin n=4 Tax=Candidatus Regiella insecticola TaxID=138073 RepID=E0WV19_9ENTR|nr:HigA family addiction module antitoxin [Candidatus Regiella insecticola]EFL91149.1 addiction module antitoxin [Candidatus Regiella insecticola LSR1]EGY28050.1 addiction module antidote protein, HigA family [Candidatus Regiella insecticola 5.15]GFN45676.1 addiction module antidote protein HigA family [Candidatus Regiella insecticola]
MKMHNPPHPGELLREGVLKPMNMKVADLARRLGMSRVSLSRVVNGHAAISSDLAVRLERAGLSTARVWMGLQADYDLWQAENREQPHIERIEAA